jgi:hypothetical protein
LFHLGSELICYFLRVHYFMASIIYIAKVSELLVFLKEMSSLKKDILYFSVIAGEYNVSKFGSYFDCLFVFIFSVFRDTEILGLISFIILDNYAVLSMRVYFSTHYLFLLFIVSHLIFSPLHTHTHTHTHKHTHTHTLRFLWFFIPSLFEFKCVLLIYLVFFWK